MDSRPWHNLGGPAPARTNALVACASFSKGLVDLYQSVIADPMNGGVSIRLGYVYVDRQTVAELLGLKAN